MARDDAVNDGPPAKRPRPTSVEDVVVERAGQGPAATKAGRGMLTLEEVMPAYDHHINELADCDTVRHFHTSQQQRTAAGAAAHSSCKAVAMYSNTACGAQNASQKYFLCCIVDYVFVMFIDRVAVQSQHSFCF